MFSFSHRVRRDFLECCEGIHFTNVNGLNQFHAALPNATGTVTRTNDFFTITISWNETDWDPNNSGQRTDTNESLSLTIAL